MQTYLLINDIKPNPNYVSGQINPWQNFAPNIFDFESRILLQLQAENFTSLKL